MLKLILAVGTACITIVPALAEQMPLSNQDQIAAVYANINMQLAKQLDAANAKIVDLQKQLDAAKQKVKLDVEPTPTLKDTPK